MKRIYPFDSNGRPHAKHETRDDSMAGHGKVPQNAVAQAILRSSTYTTQIKTKWYDLEKGKISKDEFWDFLVPLIEKVSKKVTGESFVDPKTMVSVLGLVQSQMIHDLFTKYNKNR